MDAKNDFWEDFTTRRDAYELLIEKFIIGHAMEIGRQYTGYEINHIKQCVFSMVRDYCGRGEAGSFIHAVIENDLMLAMRQADNINRHALWIYCAFIYHYVPANLAQERRRK